jgi:hypothetical protein
LGWSLSSNGAKISAVLYFLKNKEEIRWKLFVSVGFSAF